MAVAETTGGVIDVQTVAAAYEAGLRERTATLRELTDEPVRLAVLSENAYDPDVDAGELGHVARYVRGLCDAAARVGVETQVDAGLVYSDIKERIFYHNDSPATNGTVVTLPPEGAPAARRPLLTNLLIGNITRAKDVDGLRQFGVPATAEAAHMVLASVTDEKADVLVRGEGHVGRATVQLHRRFGHAVRSFDKDTPEEDQLAMLRQASVIFSATGHPEGLTSEHFVGVDQDQTKVLINIGRGTITVGSGEGAVTKTVGDFSPELVTWARERGWQVSGGAFGVGRLATLIVMSRTIAAAERRVLRTA